jgi:hypothetical protein
MENSIPNEALEDMVKELSQQFLCVHVRVWVLERER